MKSQGSRMIFLPPSFLSSFKEEGACAWIQVEGKNYPEIRVGVATSTSKKEGKEGMDIDNR